MTDTSLTFAMKKSVKLSAYLLLFNASFTYRILETVNGI